MTCEMTCGSEIPAPVLSEVGQMFILLGWAGNGLLVALACLLVAKWMMTNLTAMGKQQD